MSLHLLDSVYILYHNFANDLLLATLCILLIIIKFIEYNAIPVFNM